MEDVRFEAGAAFRAETFFAILFRRDGFTNFFATLAAAHRVRYATAIRFQASGLIFRLRFGEAFLDAVTLFTAARFATAHRFLWAAAMRSFAALLSFLRFRWLIVGTALASPTWAKVARAFSSVLISASIAAMIDPISIYAYLSEQSYRNSADA